MREKAPPLARPYNLDKPDEVRALLADALMLVRIGELSTSRAHALSALAGTLRSYIELSDVIARLSALEERLAAGGMTP